MREPLVSVIMNCYNGEKYLRGAIESVLAQSYTNFEVVFWDNISNDSTRSIVESYRDKRIKYFLAENHVPLGEARNLAIQKAQGEFIAFLDVDDVWFPEKLRKQVQYFDDPSIGLVYCNIKYIDSNGHAVEPSKTESEGNYSKITFIDLMKNYDITMSSAMISRRALNSANGLFDNLLIYAEEYDLFMRICTQFDAVRINNTLASYRIHEKQETLKLFERSVFENEYILSKLLLTNKELFDKDPELLDFKYKKTAWEKFLNEILKGQTKMARKRLRPFLFQDLKYFAFYFLSFFGPNLVKSIWKQYRLKKGRLPFSS